MTIIISRRYSETTPESAEDGEFSDTGFIAENVEYGFRELVSLLRDHPEHSGSDWFSTGYSVEDYRTGTEREETVHFSRANKPHAMRYWRLAIKAAGLHTGPDFGCIHHIPASR